MSGQKGRKKIQTKGSIYKGYCRSLKKPGYFVDPDGDLFCFGHVQKCGGISLLYSKRNLEKPVLMEKNMWDDLNQNWLEKERKEQEEKEKNELKIIQNHNCYSPGGIGYAILLSNTLVGKKISSPSPPSQPLN